MMNIETLVSMDFTDKKCEQELFDLLQTKPKIINEQNSRGQTVLHAVARDGNFRLTILVLARHFMLKQDINLQDKEGNTALHLAFAKEQWNVVTFLLSQGADKNIRNTLGIPACIASVWKKNFLNPSKDLPSKILIETDHPQKLASLITDNYIDVDAPKVIDRAAISISESSDAAQGDCKDDFETRQIALMPGGTLEDALIDSFHGDSSPDELSDDSILDKSKVSSPDMESSHTDDDIFEDFDTVTETEVIDASLQSRLSLAKDRFEKGKSLQSQSVQWLSSLGAGLKVAYNQYCIGNPAPNGIALKRSNGIGNGLI